jgi:hypothetical protein
MELYVGLSILTTLLVLALHIWMWSWGA